MSLILATGTNLGNKKDNLDIAIDALSQKFKLLSKSSVWSSAAVDYTNQPDFYNQVLEFELPSISPSEAMDEILKIEKEIGRTRGIDKGPRIIDIDIIFWGLEQNNTPHLITPHPSWSERSFVVLPLQQLPFFKTIQKHYIIPINFDVIAKEIK